MNARECIEEGFKKMKDKIIVEVEPYYMDNSENEGRSPGIKVPVHKRAKGVRNVRKKSIADIKCNRARGTRKSTLVHASRIDIVVQLSITNEDLGKDLNVLNKRRFTSFIEARIATSVLVSAYTLSLLCSCGGVGCYWRSVDCACVSKSSYKPE
ncbi:hypothetical protein M9H77_22014 [Catharanthus roseus]|uniref:Uncharacterized protein n=1 Tax=Catharanthus roseus TaxID=4058 RepID=A0ACC0APZ7_CATRO|nr:hypothetical protein M9H77_22014 [Catharanthus roseus]